jgi:hypothetical protein
VQKFGRAQIEEFTLTAGPSLGKPKPLKAVTHGKVASVRVLVLNFVKEGKPPASSARTFLLRRAGDSWLVQPTAYFSELQSAAEAAG